MADRGRRAGKKPRRDISIPVSSRLLTALSVIEGVLFLIYSSHEALWCMTAAGLKLQTNSKSHVNPYLPNGTFEAPRLPDRDIPVDESWQKETQNKKRKKRKKK